VTIKAIMFSIGVATVLELMLLYAFNWKLTFVIKITDILLGIITHKKNALLFIFPRYLLELEERFY